MLVRDHTLEAQRRIVNSPRSQSWGMFPLGWKPRTSWLPGEHHSTLQSHPDTCKLSFSIPVASSNSRFFPSLEAATPASSLASLLQIHPPHGFQRIHSNTHVTLFLRCARIFYVLNCPRDMSTTELFGHPV